jgi:glycosyltransferase involved in cell wall biosynthesis
MKIMLFEAGGYGATFQYTHNLANALAERDHHVALATGLKFETKGYPVLYDAHLAFDRFIPRPIRLFSLLRSVHTLQPDIVHIQGHLHPDIYLLIWKTLRLVSKAKLIYTAQDILPKTMRKHHPWALKRIYGSASHIFVNARQNKQKLLELFPHVKPDKITVIQIANLTAFLPVHVNLQPMDIPKNVKVALFFGIIEPRKGLMTLIRAFAKVLDQVPEAFLYVVGKVFEDVEPYFEEIKHLNLGNRVKFRNEYIPLEEIPTLFAYADVFVAPYLDGWNSGAIATAFAHGKPVIATNIGGFSEVIEHGQSGLLVAPGDEKELAEAITCILKDNELRRRMSEEARIEGEKHSWAQIAKKIEDVYLSVISST